MNNINNIPVKDIPVKALIAHHRPRLTELRAELANRGGPEFTKEIVAEVSEGSFTTRVMMDVEGTLYVPFKERGVMSRGHAKKLYEGVAIDRFGVATEVAILIASANLTGSKNAQVQAQKLDAAHVVGTRAIFDFEGRHTDADKKTHEKWAKSFVVQELMSEDLEAFVRRSWSSLPEVLAFLDEAAAALEAMHKQGLAHCDPKPANILIKAGHAKIGDLDDVTSLHELKKRAQEGKSYKGDGAYLPDQYEAQGVATDTYGFLRTIDQVLFTFPSQQNGWVWHSDKRQELHEFIRLGLTGASQPTLTQIREQLQRVAMALEEPTDSDYESEANGAQSEDSGSSTIEGSLSSPDYLDNV